MASDRTTRAEFLARVRAGLGDTSAPTPMPIADDSLVRLASGGPDVPAMFIQRARAVGMNVHPAAMNDLPRVLASLPIDKAAVSIEDASLRAFVSTNIRSLVPWRDSPGFESLYEADAGITDVFAAIAETGTLVVCSSAPTSRGGFLVPPVHVAIVLSSQILPDLVDLWKLVQPIPTSIVLITGPSKTADIEGILITGVHGPKEVHIILIEDR